ncbi:hypothetical protein ACPA54_05185 [Uniformispora flossi]|uniref:hypothetical protein n=1 Tax=Uniformispora flossi TaxID=3390723 RepID=UPI003C2BB398
METRTTAERLLLATRVGWFRLNQPVFIDRGQAYWIDHSSDELCVDRGSGRVSRHPGWTCR